MKIKIQKGSVSFDELVNHLMHQFPQYRFWKTGENTLKIAKNKFIAAYVTVRKNKIIVRGGFVNFKLYVAFTLFLLLLGVVVPLLISYIFIYPRVQMFLQEIIDEVYIFYRHTVLNYNHYNRYED